MVQKYVKHLNEGGAPHLYSPPHLKVHRPTSTRGTPSGANMVSIFRGEVFLVKRFLLCFARHVDFIMYGGGNRLQPLPTCIVCTP